MSSIHLMIHPIKFDSESTATNPGGLTLSESKLRVLEPSMFGVRRVIRTIGGALLIVNVLDLIDRGVLREHLAHGDSRAAIVLSVSPLMVAAYSDDLDCVAMLQFPARFAVDYSLYAGARLVVVNTYYAQFVKHADLTFGPNHSDQYSGFFPLIAEFVSDDQKRIDFLKQNIDEAEWRRCQELGEEYRTKRPGVARQGRPRRAHQSAGFLKKVLIGSIIGVLGIAAFVVLAWIFV